MKDILLAGLPAKDLVEHEALVLVAFCAGGHEAAVDESFSAVLFVRVESEDAVVNDLDDVAEGSRGYYAVCGCGSGEGGVRAEGGVVTGFWETGMFCGSGGPYAD